MAYDSMLYTMGTALNRAMDAHTPVELLVQGQWIAGLVLALDGHGLVLEQAEGEHYFVRVEQISVVRLMDAAPMSAPRAVEPPVELPAQRTGAQ